MSNFTEPIRPFPLRALLCCALLVATLALAPQADAASRTYPPTLQSNEQIFSTIEQLVSHGPRRPGTPGGDFAPSYMESQMRRIGLDDVTVERSRTWSWSAESSSLTVGGVPTDAFPAAYSADPGGENTGTFGTGAAGLTAPIVNVGGGSYLDFFGKNVRGKIVVFDLSFQLPLAGLLPLTEYLYDPGLSLLDAKTLFQANPYLSNYRTALKYATDRGAAGFIGVLSDYFDSNRYYNEFYSRATNPLPGMWVTKKVGAELRARMRANSALTANLKLTTRREPADAHSVFGVLPGRSDDTILVTSHHDSVWTGAVEDASGAAEVLALARHFAAQPRGSREKTLMFMTDDSHFSGYQAHAEFIRRHVFERDASDRRRLVAVAAVEHIGKAATINADGTLRISDQPEPRGIFENLRSDLKSVVTGAVRRNDLRRTAVLNGDLLQTTGIPTDVSGLMQAGVPTVSLISGPMYMYDEADTLDKVAKDQLQPVAGTFIDIIDGLDRADGDRIGYLPLKTTLAYGRKLLSD